MFAFDRDGVLLGKLGDFEASHPQYLKGIRSAEDLPFIPPVVNRIKFYNLPCVVISNQKGISTGYTDLNTVIWEFQELMIAIPQIKLSIFCPDNGYKVVALHSNGLVEKYTHFHSIYRKPAPGMGHLALRILGEPITTYVGDLSGKPGYGEGRKTDLEFADRLGCSYMDVNDFIAV